MWTVVNLVERFSHKFDFSVVTRNHDTGTEGIPYDSVITNDWNEVGAAKVYYFGQGTLTSSKTASLIEEVRPDAIFLNSAFAMPTLKVLWGVRKHRVPPVPVILAPCGELGTGSLSLKPVKKRLFLRYARHSGLYDDVLWKASSASEEEDIRKAIGRSARIMVAPDLVPKQILPEYDQTFKPKKVPGNARFVISARIVEKKNIHFFLELLQNINEGEVTFDIIGPIEDAPYWKRCQKIIAGLPGNIAVTSMGPLQQADAIKGVFDSHFFVLPSLNENFGYVLIESLAAGTPLLISDQTMWRDLERHGVGWVIPLDRPDLYANKVRECISMNDERYSSLSAASRAFALDWLADGAIYRATERVLETAMSRPARNL